MLFSALLVTAESIPLSLALRLSYLPLAVATSLQISAAVPTLSLLIMLLSRRLGVTLTFKASGVFNT
nr:MAG: hypothetical protein [Bacteriophage sp.]